MLCLLFLSLYRYVQDKCFLVVVMKRTEVVCHLKCNQMHLIQMHVGNPDISV